MIDGSGLALSPGFIDTHTHSDSKILNDPAHEHSLRQGVTTEILGQDGLSYAPLSPKNYRLNSEYLSGLLGNPPNVILSLPKRVLMLSIVFESVSKRFIFRVIFLLES